MKFMADENFPRHAVFVLRRAGFDVNWISEECSGSSDDLVLSICSEQRRILLTFDKDFGDLAFRQKLDAASGILLFRIRPQDPDEIAHIALAALGSGIDWRGNFSVVTKLGIRTRPLVSNP